MKKSKFAITLMGLAVGLQPLTSPLVTDPGFGIHAANGRREFVKFEIAAASHTNSTIAMTKPYAARLDVGYTPATYPVYEVWVTAYSSTPDQTDDTPFITATGNRVRDGILAANFLPFGTRVLIPKAFGDKVFTVDDRMHKRKKDYVDIWMSTRSEAKRFGITRTQIVVVD